MRQSGKNNGYFTLHNVKFQPSAKDPEYVQKDDCVASDIDVVGFHPKRKSYEQVWAVSCKSWQAGFDPRRRIELINANRKVSGRLAWQAFRELVKKKWADGLIEKLESLTGSTKFTYRSPIFKLPSKESLTRTRSLDSAVDAFVREDSAPQRARNGPLIGLIGVGHVAHPFHFAVGTKLAGRTVAVRSW